MKLGRYEIVRELGKGAMGVVYLAKDPLIGRLVALKTIRAARGDDDETREFQQRFIREAQAAGILNHPAIVTVHDIGQDEPSGTNFIAMEFVEGQNLKEILAQGRPLSFDEIGDIIAQVGEALDFAHAKGIVHRDVKPANIIMLEGNQAEISRLRGSFWAHRITWLPSRFAALPSTAAPISSPSAFVFTSASRGESRSVETRLRRFLTRSCTSRFRRCMKSIRRFPTATKMSSPSA
ncbi:MAG: hypothetical protein DMF58_16840 [Acidobacteria bacterium]|nr:MAG: hypothetical protein DMF58_16840 [Acidobacteriota bacterium]